MKKKNAPLSSPVDLRMAVLELLTKNKGSLTKNQMAHQLNIRGDGRIFLRQSLSDLETEGKINRGPRRRFFATRQSLMIGQLLAAEVTTLSDDGELLATPLEWASDLPAPEIEVFPLRASHSTANYPTLPIGTHVLVRLTMLTNNRWQAHVIKQLEKIPKVQLGLFTRNPDQSGQLSPCHRKDSFPGVRLTSRESKNLQSGDVVTYAVSARDGLFIHEKIGTLNDPKTFSQMALYAYNLPHIFSEEALTLSEQRKIPGLQHRKDYRNVPLVTIDGEDARDFDDAVSASPDPDPQNPGGWRILVAIADVAYYVRQGDALDREAKERGNSVYFPDRVVPMLPEALSNGLCSLKPHEDRACLVVEMVISARGKVKSRRIKRGLMRSHARLTYDQVQQAIDGRPDEVTKPLLDSLLKPLYGAYHSLLKARQRRGTLEIEQLERQVIFGQDGHINCVIPRLHYDSHRLIEEFMIAANVAAAKILEDKGWPCLYRIHDAPDPLRVANLRQILRQMKVSFTKSKSPEPKSFNSLLTETRHTPFAQMINDLTLRSQAQAQYHPVNIGHYGLNLIQYAHFTSPIRRYADLLVHRALIGALQLGEGGFSSPSIHLKSVAGHLSTTERQAAIAERDVMDRFVTAYHAPQVGHIFEATIVGVNKAGLFAAIKETGAQGFIPRSSFLGDSFYYEADNHRLIGRRTKQVYQLGESLKVCLQSADIAMNSLIFDVVQDIDDMHKRKVFQKKYLKKRKFSDHSLKKNKRKKALND